MPRDEHKPESGNARPQPGKNAEPREIQEELAFLYQKCNSLSMRGQYPQCLHAIEDNLKYIYDNERWPENFFPLLRLHQKCYPSLGKAQPHDQYLGERLKKLGLPHVLAGLLRQPDKSITWSVEFFRDKAMESREQKAYDDGLAYADIIAKIDPGSTVPYIVKGKIYEEMGRGPEAVRMYLQSLEVNAADRRPLRYIAEHYLETSPAKAMDYVNKLLELEPERGENHALRAAVLQKLGEYDTAIEAIDEAVRCDPLSADYLYQKAEIYYAQGNQVKAAPQYRLAIAANPNHLPSLLRLTSLSFEQQPEIALKYLNTIHAVAPENQDACLLRAQLLRRRGELENAKRQYQQLLELNAESHQAEGGLGELYLVQGQYPRAMVHLERAVALAPDIAAYHQDKGVTHSFLDQLAEAETEFRTAVRLDPKNDRAWAALAGLTMDKNPKEALAHLDKAIAIRRDNPEYHTMKGELLLGQRNFDEAIECFDTACACDPGNAELHARLGRMLLELERLTSARDHFQKAVSLDPEDAESFYGLARISYDTHPEKALEYINEAIRISVTRGDYYFLKTRIVLSLLEDGLPLLERQLKNRKTEEESGPVDEIPEMLAGNGLHVALRYINRAIELDPSNAAYLCQRAQIHYRLGQKKQALEQYDKLLRANSSQHEALIGMARIYADQKDKRAQEYFDKAIACAPAMAAYHAEKAAYLAEQEGRYDEALQAYEQALSLNPLAWQVILGKARLMDAHGDEDGAIVEYRRVLLLRPDILQAAARMGQLLCDRAPASALPYLDQAVRLEPDNPQHYAWRARAYYNLGAEVQAEENLRAVDARGGSSGETRFMLAQALAGHRPEPALEHCEAAIGVQGDKAEYHLLRGRLLRELGRGAEARESLERAFALDPKLHDALEQLADIAWDEAAPDSAERVEAALQNRPDCPDCLYRRARQMEAAGDVPGALEAVTAAVKGKPDAIPYREKLVELLGKRRSFIKLAVEKRKLERLYKRSGQQPEWEVPLDLGEEGEQEAAGPEREEQRPPRQAEQGTEDTI